MKLYSYWRSSAAYRVRIALNLKRVDYDVVPVSLSAGAQTNAAYRAVNPQMLVPFLVDGDFALGQSQAIFEYLEETHPEPPLLPKATRSRAEVRAIANMICCDIHPLNNLRVLNYLRDELDASEEQRNRWYGHWIALGFAAVEALIEPYRNAGPYSFGSQVTLADVCLVPQVYNARRFKVALDAFPRIVDIVAACNRLDAFAAAAPERQPDAA